MIPGASPGCRSGEWTATWCPGPRPGRERSPAACSGASQSARRLGKRVRRAPEAAAEAGLLVIPAALSHSMFMFPPGVPRYATSRHRGVCSLCGRSRPPHRGRGVAARGCWPAAGAWAFLIIVRACGSEPQPSGAAMATVFEVTEVRNLHRRADVVERVRRGEPPERIRRGLCSMKARR